jgi:hypothetical protein
MLTALFVVLMQIPGYPNGCEKCGLKSAVDWVQMVDLPEGRRPVVAGYAVECFSGHRADRAYVYAWDGERNVPVAAEIRWTIARPDVQAVWAPVCYDFPIDAMVGFGLVLTGPLPPHTTRLSVALGWGAYQQTHTITVLTLDK